MTYQISASSDICSIFGEFSRAPLCCLFWDATATSMHFLLTLPNLSRKFPMFFFSCATNTHNHRRSKLIRLLFQRVFIIILMSFSRNILEFFMIQGWTSLLHLRFTTRGNIRFSFVLKLSDDRNGCRGIYWVCSFIAALEKRCILYQDSKRSKNQNYINIYLKHPKIYKEE